MAALTSFRTEECCHVVNENEAYAAAYAGYWSIVIINL